ncbi:MAG TPA: metallopeptidase TldD-related protein [Thermoanaerobaculia bacterium]|nr:metallopeptidase TldD-related protein [Thermoanaerobaculia bacterium]
MSVKSDRTVGAATVQSLLGEGYEEAELFAKTSRSRSATWEADRLTCAGADERGWAVRASGAEGSLHCAGTGSPPAQGPWPRPAAPPVQLPSAAAVAPPWEEPADFDAPLLAEGEALALLRSVAERLVAEHSRARLLQAILEDGVAELALKSSHGIEASHRARVATLDLWAALGDQATRMSIAAREPRRFAVGSLARRLADQLVVLSDGTAPTGREPSPAVLTGEVLAAAIDALHPLWFEPGGWSRLERLADAQGTLGSAAFTVVDDGRLRGGLLTAPTDGEGVATGRVVLVESGSLRRTLRSWRHEGPGEPVGCVRRPGWRDLPRVGPSHLMLEPDPRVTPSSLLEELGSGYYFLGLEGPVAVDWEEGRVDLPVYGFAIRAGRSSHPIRAARASASLTGLFTGIQRVARDLRFISSAGGCVGAPTVLVDHVSVGPA